MTLNEVTERFFKMENDLKLFDQQIEGINYWEIIRFSIHRELLQQLGLVDTKSSSKKFTFYEKIKLFLNSFKSYIFRNPFLSPKNKIVFFGLNRRVLNQDGIYEEIYTDFILDELNISDYTVLEEYLYGKHLTPVRTQNLFYLDIMAPLNKIMNILKVIKEPECNEVANVISEINNIFNISMESTKYINIVKMFPISKRSFTGLFKVIQPKKLFVVCSYGKEAAISAAKDLGIKTIELQHGTMSSEHLGYHFPGGKKEYFPDEFWAFGEFWLKNTALPIKCKSTVFGYPYLEYQHHKLIPHKKEDIILFISQWAIGDKLSQYALKLSQNISNKVYYKLHPGEYSYWKEKYPYLVDSNIVVIAGESNLYELLLKSKVVIGVYSTALYEAIYFKCQVFILSVSGYEAMKGLIKQNIVQEISESELSLDFNFKNNELENASIIFHDDWKAKIAKIYD